VLSQVDRAAEVIAGHPAGFYVTAPVGFDKIRMLAATADAAQVVEDHGEELTGGRAEHRVT
jgi:hypothetical protein